MDPLLHSGWHQLDKVGQKNFTQGRGDFSPGPPGLPRLPGILTPRAELCYPMQSALHRLSQADAPHGALDLHEAPSLVPCATSFVSQDGAPRAAITARRVAWSFFRSALGVPCVTSFVSQDGAPRSGRHGSSRRMELFFFIKLIFFFTSRWKGSPIVLCTGVPEVVPGGPWAVARPFQGRLGRGGSLRTRADVPDPLPGDPVRGGGEGGPRGVPGAESEPADLLFSQGKVSTLQHGASRQGLGGLSTQPPGGGARGGPWGVPGGGPWAQ